MQIENSSTFNLIKDASRCVACNFYFALTVAISLSIPSRGFGLQVFENYHVTNNNCHSAANNGNLFIPEARPPNTWGVFSCHGDRAKTSPYTDHTLNWVAIRDETEIVELCLIEPQSPTLRECWTPLEEEKILQRPILTAGSSGQNEKAIKAAKKLCDDQFHGIEEGRYASLAFQVGIKAASPEGSPCVRKALGLPDAPMEFTNVSIPRLDPAKKSQYIKDCHYCCNAAKDTVSAWARSPETGQGDKEAKIFQDSCVTQCNGLIPLVISYSQAGNADTSPLEKVAIMARAALESTVTAIQDGVADPKIMGDSSVSEKQSKIGVLPTKVDANANLAD